MYMDVNTNLDRVSKFSRETHKIMGKMPSMAGALSALISHHFATKRYTRDEDDGEEDAFAGCIWRGRRRA